MNEEDLDWLDQDEFRYVEPEDADGEWKCSDERCLNPHIIHRRSECFTREDAEALERSEA
jgi:hypothetical protein